MKTKILLTLALLTAPRIQPADPQAHPQFVGNVLAGHSIRKIITHPSDPNVFAAAIPTYIRVEPQSPSDRIAHIFCICCFSINDNHELEELGVFELSNRYEPYPEMVFRKSDGALLVVDEQYHPDSKAVDINLWNITENQHIARHPYILNGECEEAFFTAGGEYLVISKRYHWKTITLIDTISGKERIYDLEDARITGPNADRAPLSSLSFTRHAWVLDSDEVVVSVRDVKGSQVGYIRAYNIDTKENLGGLQTSFAGSYALSTRACLADFSGTAFESGTLRLINLVNGTSSSLNHPELNSPQGLSLITFNNQGSLLIVETYISELGKSPMIVWNTTTSEAACLFADTTTSLSMSCGGFAFDATNTHMLLATWDGVEIWDISSIINQLQEPEDGKREE